MNLLNRAISHTRSADSQSAGIVLRLKDGAPAFGVRRLIAAFAAPIKAISSRRMDAGSPLKSADQSPHAKRFATVHDFCSLAVLGTSEGFRGKPPSWPHGHGNNSRHETARS
ncbi:MAG: hypothetical protein HY735_13765 [Verrucomicrobia bacterium]|nr:hypothetical protein [Verrucomicrobiota bacterium]